MLVLTRKQQETIQIGENIKITILRFKGQAVSVGIEAPRDVRVVRGELERFETAPAGATEEPTQPRTTIALPAFEATPGESQVVQFRFSPRAEAMPGSGRGPLSAFLPHLHAEGCVVESVAQ